MKFIYAALVAAVSAECMDGIEMSMYTDKECKTAFENKAAKVEAKHKITKAELEEMNKKCAVVQPQDAAYWKAQKFDAKSVKVTCDTKEIATTVSPRLSARVRPNPWPSPGVSAK